MICLRDFGCVFIGISLLCGSAVAGEESTEEVEKDIQALAQGLLSGSLNEVSSYLSLRRINHESDQGSDGWAVDYDWSKDWDAPLNVTTTDTILAFSGSSLRAFAKGSVALGSATNDNEKSSAGVSAMFHGSRKNLRTQEHSAEYEACVLSIPVVLGTSTEAHQKRCALLHSGTGGTIAYDAGFSYMVEGDENFSEEHEVYSAHALFVYSPTPRSIFDKLNFLDIPFRALRQASGGAGEYTAKLPSVRVAFEQVDPKDDTVRNALPDGQERFDRFYYEIAFSTKAFKVRNAFVSFEASYRVYDERDAPDAIRAAGLDRFEYGRYGLYFPVRVLGLEGLNDEVFVEYSKGDLPFDVSRGEAVTVGWKTNFKSLLENLIPTN